MTDFEKPLLSLHQRVETLRQDFDRELASLVAEVDAAREVIEKARTAGSSQDKRLRQLEERAEGQSALIATLTQEAQEARALRDEVRNRELEIEKQSSELASKSELIHALRQQLGDVDGIKTTAKQRDKKIFEQQHELDRQKQELDRKQQELDRKQQDLDERQQALESAQSEIDLLRSELAMAAETSQVETSVDTAEIVALKSELDARKSMIRSLRADAERAEALEGQLEAKRETIAVLEESIDQHGKTIAELRRSVDAWKKKYQAAKGQVGEEQDQTLVEAPEFTDTEIEALKALDKANAGTAPDRTLAIDMRDALKEARRQKAQAKSRA